MIEKSLIFFGLVTLCLLVVVYLNYETKIIYYDDGVSIERKQTYRFGDLKLEKEYYENGQIEYRAKYRDEDHRLKSWSWYDSGEIKHKTKGSILGKYNSKYFFKNGNPKSIFINNKNYEVKHWYENGQLEYESFSKGCNSCLGSGISNSTRYYKDGSIAAMGKYIFATSVGRQKTWHENGQLKTDLFLTLGEFDGVQKLWYEDGQLESIGNYKFDSLEVNPNYAITIKNPENYSVWYGKNKSIKLEDVKESKKDGPQQYWHENGLLKEEHTYREGKLYGLHRKWNKDGALIFEEVYP